MSKKVLLSLLPLLLLCVLLIGCSSPHPEYYDHHTHSEESRTPKPSAKPSHSSVSSSTSQTGAAQSQQTGGGSGTAEAKISEALSSSGSAIFRVSSDFTFNNAQGTGTYGSNGSTTSTINLETGVAENLLAEFLFNQVIRIENGTVFMDDADYQCQMSVSAGSISVRITRGDYTSATQGEMTGTLSGNTLSGNIEVSSLTIANGQSNGYVANGMFQVSLTEVTGDQLPPKPPVNLQYTINGDDSVTLTWEDPNPSGTVVSFEIIGSYAIASDYETLATVGTTEWTDTSERAKSVQYDVISYYIIAHGANGVDSEISDFISIYYY